MIYHRLLHVHGKLKIIKIEGTMEWEWILAETLFLYYISIPINLIGYEHILHKQQPNTERYFSSVMFIAIYSYVVV